MTLRATLPFTTQGFTLHVCVRQAEINSHETSSRVPTLDSSTHAGNICVACEKRDMVYCQIHIG